MPARRFATLLLSALLAAATTASAQQGAMITPNYKDADLGQVIEAVSQVTGKNFIVDPRVRAQVTMLSATPMSAGAFYEAFLAILQVHGFVAVPAGNVIKILPDANARQLPANDLPDRVSATSDEIVTQVIQVRNTSAAQLVPILRPLIPQFGHLAAYPASNILIISDRASNVNRMVRIIQRIDQSGEGDIEVIRLEHASAAEIVRVVNALTQAQGADAGTPAAKAIADDRTNSVLVSGEGAQRLRLKTIITHLDTPLESGGDTQVRYLRYADAEKIAPKLKEQLTGIVAATTPGGPQAASGAQTDRSITIWADKDTNALIITAPPKVMRSIMGVVDRLDIRREQVQVEALIVEVTRDLTRDLGVNWIVDGSGDNLMVGLFNQAIGGVSLAQIWAGVEAINNGGTGGTGGTGSTTTPTAPGGFTLGVGRQQETGTNFAAILRALAGDGNTNIVSMPSVITMDNEEAQIKVAQEVPFVTGQYTSTGGSSTSVNPFTTVQRQEVGTILKITPQITDDNTVLLKISQEISSLAANSQAVGAVDLITNKRTIETRVLVDDGGMIVLGGLMSDTLTDTESRVPGLGSIPILGELFRVRSSHKTKTNLLVFIRPKVLRTAEQAAIETNAKYNYIRNQQKNANGGRVPLMPMESQPLLPELLGPLTPAPAPNQPSPEAAPIAQPPGGSQP
ncbi:MAG: type II secretion system secretin GspD [Gammaproteobacteria bacterium]|nr:type II secretion system secretin GspD [Gammaproteobacteria bacterium]